ncbi:endonuclease/exonuclease/phosphatase family protein [Yeosuana marina]|uniref:endonuclease/exonuclease/phosphatase family protein n=1 Tax=Yeosuana marina TaxID=1565536 RepID=UPI0030EC1387|tara:strand:- start:333 stop:1499 length:1167 start_codon:yes stop_codon:yes gene_type:complete
MNRFVLISVLLLSFSASAQTINDLSFGTNDTFEIMTWNIQEFPKNNQATIYYVTQIIEALDIDFIAIQEISNQTAFNDLVDGLANYNGHFESTEYDGLAFLYKPDVITVNRVYRIFETSNYWNVFPRAPMVVDITYNNQHLYIINNHLKCCGDGTLSLGDTTDEENRRYEAVNLLKNYIDTNLQNENVILLGDLNDVLSDGINNNVFQSLIDDTSNYLFADHDIAFGRNTNWSYPTWPSHLDHILITNELFDEFALASSTTETIKIDDYLSNGWTEYDQNVSDHRPVALKLTLDSNLGVNDVSKNQSSKLINYPNPFNTSTTFSFKNISGNTQIEIFNVFGQSVFNAPIANGQTKFQWTTQGLSNGIYFVKLVSDKKIIAHTKVVLAR